MSSQAAEELGLNAVMVHFPWLPYYQSYQFGFDIIVDPSKIQADPSVADPPLRVIHVQLHFPDGLMCNPAGFGRLPHPSASSGGAPHFLPPHPHSHPPMFPIFPHTTSRFHHRMPMDFRQEEHKARVILYVLNGRPGDWMLVGDKPYDAVPQCKKCGEFHKDPDHMHNQRPRGASKRNRSQQPHKQSGGSRRQASTSGTGHPRNQASTSATGASKQLPATSGTPGQSDMSHAAPYAPTKHVPAPPKKRVMGKDKPNKTQLTTGKPKYEGMKRDNIKVFHREVEVVTITDEEENRQLDVGSQKNDEKVAQGNKKPSFDRGTQTGN